MGLGLSWTGVEEWNSLVVAVQRDARSEKFISGWVGRHSLTDKVQPCLDGGRYIEFFILKVAVF